MPTPGYVFRDGGTTPEEEKSEHTTMAPSTRATTSSTNKTIVTPASEKKTTADKGPAFLHPAVKADAPLSKDSSLSHTLAVSKHEVTGSAQAAGQSDEVCRSIDLRVLPF